MPPRRRTRSAPEQPAPHLPAPDHPTPDHPALDHPALDLPVLPPVEPMLAAATDAVPAADAVEGGYWYEPKWDGFRCIVFYDGSGPEPAVELGSRGGRSLTRYFPEVVAELGRQLGAARCVLDGELVVRAGERGRERLDWDALSQRIHPAASRVQVLSASTPASLVVFDLLAEGDDSLLDVPLSARRQRLETLLATVRAPLHLTQVTEDADLARRWLADFEGAGLDGVVAKPRDAVYAPGRRVLRKVKHARTADVVVLGYRVHTSGHGVGSLLLGLAAPEGEDGPRADDGTRWRQVGGAAAFTAARRVELLDELAPYVVRDEAGEPVRGEGERSRFSRSRDASFVRLRPELVCEVAYDQLEKGRFRHVVRLLRWRPDRDAASCTFEQLEVPRAYDLDAVLTGG